ncbi:TIGR03503 family protein [Photobacterium aphoticum]|uniref:Glutamate synthase n=1 Tax=Photobacterium aphoticum TaxID=754436 RepID=A0A0J1JCA4_9GAMM|nr:TIGR03503 family protein [Photobacterium aphoticum]KLU99211.1 glutamate synthase [Photobacterium aphoticum]PSU56220.1 TIGR03503 family protein [Photobacterium aphoticum]GHA63190.1 glutamate synthase [Photobacterium aphoticum]
MKRLWWLVMLLPLWSWASTMTESAWLDNRFRVDPTVKQVSFVVKRDTKSNSVVIVRPDGHKYYAWRHPDHVAWYEEPGIDIISIDNPMPGPWQAIGSVTPKNKVVILSDLALSVDTLPDRIYQSETIKFTARLSQDGKPLTLRDFLDRVKLSVVFYEYVEHPDTLPKEALPVPISQGEFSDDGRQFDEHPGDGVFTVAMQVDLPPGKYRVRISSGNGIFLRTQEQVVLVYPPPLNASFIQGRGQDEQHQVVVTAEEGAIKPGSLAAHITQVSADGTTTISEQAALPDEITLKVWLPNGELPGRYTWSGWLYATDNMTGRELVFRLPESHFAVMAELQLDRNLNYFREQQAEKARLAEYARIEAEREAARSKAVKIIIGLNIVVLIVVIGGIVWWRKRRVKHMLDRAGLEVPES